MEAQIEVNERILAAVEAAGGGYVWDAEVFAVTLMDVVPNDEFAATLGHLVGVQQIRSTRLSSHSTHSRHLSQIKGLNSLVLNHAVLTNDETTLLASFVPKLMLVNE